MEINHSANFTNLEEFINSLKKIGEKSASLSFSGNITAGENDQDNFSINWTSDEEV